MGTPKSNIGWVYFIQGGPERLIKIGTSKDPIQRLRNMQGGCPVELTMVATVPGDGGTEARLHKRFEKSWSHNEWFWPTDDLLALIYEIDPNSMVQAATTTMEEFEERRWAAMLRAARALEPTHMNGC